MSTSGEFPSKSTQVPRLPVAPEVYGVIDSMNTRRCSTIVLTFFLVPKDFPAPWWEMCWGSIDHGVLQLWNPTWEVTENKRIWMLSFLVDFKHPLQKIPFLYVYLRYNYIYIIYVRKGCFAPVFCSFDLPKLTSKTWESNNTNQHHNTFQPSPKKALPFLAKNFPKANNSNPTTPPVQ